MKRCDAIPVSGDTLSFVTSFYEGIQREADQAEAKVREALHQYYLPAGLFLPTKRNFFFYHYADSFARVLEFMGGNPDSPDVTTILDLGCGLGTQSLMFAIRGARVVAIDLDGDALDILGKRRLWYSERLGRELDITCVYGNALNFDFHSLGRIDGIQSLFAFNIMQPSRAVLDRICAILRPGGRLAIQDGNRESLWNLVLGRRRDVLRPDELRRELEQCGMMCRYHRPTGSVPPQVCSLFDKKVIDWLDRRLNSSWRIGVSQQILVEKVR
jgi:SAM-dependent methyltransferase